MAQASPEPATSKATAALRHQPVPVSGRDRVYTADQSSNTVSVIDPSTNRTLGTIKLGDQRVGGTLSPQYLGDVGVHGLAFSPDRRRLAVVSVTSNTVDIIDTTTNKVVSTTDVGRAAHEGSFTADGKQFWVANRGRGTVTVVDAVRGGVVANLQVGEGPSKVLMSPDGRTAYVNHISKPEITVIDVQSRRIKDQITGLGDIFSSDQAISPDGKELWAAHKRAGKVSVVDLVHNKVASVLTTGPDTNHPQFADIRTGKYVYVTMGGLDETWVYSRTGGAPTLVDKIKNNGHAPHGAWASGDGSRLYVGLEKSDAVDVIDTATNKVTDTIKTGQEPQAVVYAPRAAAAGNASNLGRQGLDQQARNVPTVLPDGTAGDTLDPEKGRVLEATIRPLSGLDMIQIQARRLRPNTVYQAYSVGSDGRKNPVLSFPTDANGRTPMALAFGAFDGRSISIQVKGEATPVQKAAFAAQGAVHGHGVKTADLLYCDCC
ncbi:beta-propeller fold lactonase family protein [Streptomyces sp. NBC_01485]|uniref:beta-propeller fold lactonase family protein n=1 Tax=Streptomyces sp. NBC_01485 TaxID=2903884 RepID=UPI002E331F94|nr:beta-propeller fold lactonase family protein [Streptomyces sp. NBC_01485]